jgi:flagellar protein FliO/FliZ
MQFLTSLLGGSGNQVLNAVFALAIVLILIFLALWALRAVTQASNKMVRGNRKRLAVVDMLPVDGKRHLVIIRRDNVEHLILTGGPQDVVVETGIAVDLPSTAPRPIPTIRRPQQANAAPQQAAPPPPQYPPLSQRAPMEAPAPYPPLAPRPGPIETAAQPVPNNDASERGPLDRLRELGRAPDNSRRLGSLRHTGLMRPVSRMEPAFIPANADNSGLGEGDSATSGRIMPFGAPRDGNAQEYGDGHPNTNRDESY